MIDNGKSQVYVLWLVHVVLSQKIEIFIIIINNNVLSTKHQYEGGTSFPASTEHT